MIGRSGERGSGMSMLAARHDDDDDGIRNDEMLNGGYETKWMNDTAGKRRTLPDRRWRRVSKVNCHDQIVESRKY